MLVDGSRLKEIRRDHHDTQEKLAEKLHVSTSAVSKWEQGTAEPSLDCLVQICRMYEVSSDFLLGLTDDDPFLTKKKRSKLSAESKTAIKLFEEYLYHKDKANQ